VARSAIGIRGTSARAAAFQDLAEQHLDASYRLARAILGNRGEAEDATHDALVQAWHHWGQLRDEGRFEPWFDRILVNVCRNRLRQSSRQKVIDLSPEAIDVLDVRAANRDPMAFVHDRDQIRAALGRLSPDHRIVVALRFFKDLPIDEIAARTGVPIGTATSRLHYALKQLREGIEA
jgi:RNA polymerase sigma-70 factor, ECF subfamily